MIQILGTIFDAIHILIYFPTINISSSNLHFQCYSYIITLKEDQNIIYDKNEIVKQKDIHKEDIPLHPSN
jgi:hypothetical protein